ncbi:hypothetical protein [Pseudopedobacter sp.]|uniref:hypothetical protein n=1 Tax=Pseudopedobacter sp. TaxID=1936787 RepID=UPI003342C963
MAASTKKTEKETIQKTDIKETKNKSKKVSKTWLAALKNVGTGEIVDMRAVLK